MNNNIKRTLVATAVSVALTSSAFAATEIQHNSKTLPRFDYNLSKSSPANAQVKDSRGAGLRSTASLSSHKIKTQSQKVGSKTAYFDDTLGVSTFSWAKNNDRSPVSVLPYSKEYRKLAISKSAGHFASVNALKHGATAKSLEQAELKSVHDIGRGAVIVKYQQRVNGIEVLDRQLNVVLNQQMQLVATSGYFSKNKESKHSLSSQFSVSASDAISKAFTDMGGDAIILTKAREQAEFTRFTATGSEKFSFSEEPRSKKIYYSAGDRFIPAYYIELLGSALDSSELVGYTYIISAEDGILLRRNSMVHSEALPFTYKVFAEDTAPYRPYDYPAGDKSPHPTGIFDSPIDETQATMNYVNITNAGLSTNDPWLADDATSTSGNNVEAYADIIAPNGYQAPDIDADGNPTPGDLIAATTSANIFDYPYNMNDAVDNENNMNAAIVNLFYVNNYMHDLYYDHGFDEASGNAQVDNYGRGGLDGDPIKAEAQDYSGLNNANMSTPLDGSSPQMQMYLFKYQPSNDTTMTIAGIDNLTYQLSNSLGAQEFAEFSADIVRMTHGVDEANDGCESANNGAEVAGKIAMVDRGGCAFKRKATKAQDAGAVAVIVVNNNVDGPDEVIDMGGTKSSITIPAVMVSYNSGLDIDALLLEGSVQATLSSVASEAIYRDGTMDNPIIEHEWGHYISNRLISGLHSNEQGGAMGEGWGDFIALMTMVREEDNWLSGNDMWQGIYHTGAYALNTGSFYHPYYFGIRRLPYTTDMNYNALTFKHISDGVALPTHHQVSGGGAAMAGLFNAEVHAAGEIWANTLFEAYVALLNRKTHSFDQAQSRMMDYIVAGMKITPSAPTFTEARDAILAVAIANDPEDYQVMRDAFTKRGMGANAVSPARYDTGWQEDGFTGVVEDFISIRKEVAFSAVETNNNYNGINGSFCDADSTLDVGETASISVSAQNLSTSGISGLRAQLSSDADVTFSNNGVIDFSDMAQWNDIVSTMAEVKLNSAALNESVAITVEFISDDQTISVPDPQVITFEVNRDFVKDEAKLVERFEHIYATYNDWTINKVGPEDSGIADWLNDWVVVPPTTWDYGTGNYMWGPNGDVATDVTLTTPVINVAASGDFAMNFEHYYEFEADSWDGGVVEISVDGGDWTDVVDAGGVFDIGYNGQVLEYNPYLPNRNAFVEYLTTDYAPEAIRFADGLLNGKDVQLRFRIGTDGAVGGWGWNIDNVTFTSATNTIFSVMVADTATCVNRNPIVTVTDQMVDEITDGSQSRVTLSASTLDHDTDELTYSWTQTSGPDVNLSDATAAELTFLVPVIGTDTDFGFEVVVNDGTVNINAHTIVHVADVNVAPVVSGGKSITLEETEATRLVVSATDADGDDISYNWQVNGAAVSSSTNFYLYHAPPVDADTTAVVTVSATDGDATSEVETFDITIKNKSSGGSLGLLSLLLVPFAFFRRRKFNK
ncbi:M36 family metallopeptidase [Colwellia sp. MB3u-4]|uniref:M36 family metallopeptidase n=1 Tax=Colwellia sp. MB3u-4 TaxID=2759822 RepID=UPI0015F4240A|nr:M36 family metallopeptidase [Colwellia sp. MB3u-4]MBA6289495.1 M36 family metallopeptidase [Colwellia sp. MB3u-4]